MNIFWQNKYFREIFFDGKRFGKKKKKLGTYVFFITFLGEKCSLVGKVFGTKVIFWVNIFW